MHPLFVKASGLTETIIAAAIEVHRDKGPGLIESIYEWCLTKELGLRGLDCVNQKASESHRRHQPPDAARSEPMNARTEQEGTEVTETERNNSVSSVTSCSNPP